MTDDGRVGPADHPSRSVFYVRLTSGTEAPTGAPVMRGLADNRAAPVELLLHLLQRHPDAVHGAFRCRADLPAPVIEAMLHHSSASIRGALAGNRTVDPWIRQQLADDPDPNVIDRLRADRTLDLPDVAFRHHLDRLSSHFARGLMTSEELAEEVDNYLTVDRRATGAAMRHPQPWIRANVLRMCQRSHTVVDDGLVQAFADDGSAEVRAGLADYLAAVSARDPAGEVTRADLRGNGYEIRSILSTRRLSRSLTDQLVATDNAYDLAELAGNPNTPSDVLDALFRHPEPQVRIRLAVRDDLTAAQLTRLAADPDVSVRTAVSLHPGLTERERADIDIDVDVDATSKYLGCVEMCSYTPTPRPTSAAQITDWARSGNPLLRRRAVRDHRLPRDMAAALSGDPDPGVRVLLACHHHEVVPPSLLLRVFREYAGCGRSRFPLLPTFPTAGLASFADDPDPAVRQLVALDPLAPSDVVDRLTGDPDGTVRFAMARSARLPLGRIIALCDDPELAEPAAANPALPVVHMWRLSAR